MKNKKGQTIYSEVIFFPAEFRIKHQDIHLLPPWVIPVAALSSIVKGANFIM